MRKFGLYVCFLYICYLKNVINLKFLTMKRLKLFFFVVALLTSFNAFADNNFIGPCKIYYSMSEYDDPTFPRVKHAPKLNADEQTGGLLFVSFYATLGNVEIVVSYEGMELYKDSNLSTVCGDTFSYSLTEAGEYTTFVYVNGELVEEETILVNP